METHIDIHQLIDAKKLIRRGYSNEAIQDTLVAALAKQVQAIPYLAQKAISEEDMATFEQDIAQLSSRLAESGFIMETEESIELSLSFKVKHSNFGIQIEQDTRESDSVKFGFQTSQNNNIIIHVYRKSLLLRIPLPNLPSPDIILQALQKIPYWQKELEESNQNDAYMTRDRLKTFLDEKNDPAERTSWQAFADTLRNAKDILHMTESMASNKNTTFSHPIKNITISFAENTQKSSTKTLQSFSCHISRFGYLKVQKGRLLEDVLETIDLITNCQTQLRQWDLDKIRKHMEVGEKTMEAIARNILAQCAFPYCMQKKGKDLYIWLKLPYHRCIQLKLPPQMDPIRLKGILEHIAQVNEVFQAIGSVNLTVKNYGNDIVWENPPATESPT